MPTIEESRQKGFHGLRTGKITRTIRIDFILPNGESAFTALLESLAIEEPQSREIYRNGARRQLALLEKFRLVFANVIRAQTENLFRGNFN